MEDKKPKSSNKKSGNEPNAEEIKQTILAEATFWVAAAFGFLAVMYSMEQIWPKVSLIPKLGVGSFGLGCYLIGFNLMLAYLNKYKQRAMKWYLLFFLPALLVAIVGS